MAQLAVVYRFQIRAAGDTSAPWQPLGDIDGAGTRLVDVLPAGFQAVDYEQEVGGHAGPSQS